MSGWQRGLRPSLSILITLVLLAGVLQLTRPGYSVDEEFTIFAVRGITADGLPVLPSGMLYDRGLAYSYASWLVGLLPGPDLPAYRALSLACAALSLILVVVLVRRAAEARSALLAAMLASSTVPFWAAATTGRFYAPFLAGYLGLLVVLAGSRNALLLVVVAAIARLTHELAFTAAVVPALFAVLSPKTERAAWIKATAMVVAGLLAAQAAILVFHYLAPSSGETMIRRFFLWQVLNLFETPPDRQFGLVLLVMLIAWLVAPSRAGLVLIVGLCGVAMVLGASIAPAMNVAPMSLTLIGSVLTDGSRYPLDMFWHLARTTPLSLVLALALIAARLLGIGGEWRAPERAAHLAWLGWVVWFGVIESGITINYLLVPVTLMMTAIAIDTVAIMGRLLLPPAFAVCGHRARGRRGDRRSVARFRIDRRSPRRGATNHRSAWHRSHSRRTSTRRSRGLYRRAGVPPAGRARRRLAGT